MESSAFPSESAKIEKRRYAAGDDCVADPDDAKCSTAVKRHKKQPLASEHGVESVDASSAPLGITKLPKRTYALVFGYLGSGFYGMQKQLNAAGEEVVRTVEGELEKAIIKCGAISVQNAGCQRKVHWTRVARTDKGVHAAAQVIALKLQLPAAPNEKTEKAVLSEEDSEAIEEAQLALASNHVLSESLSERERYFLSCLRAQLAAAGLRDNCLRVFNVYRVTKSFDARLQCSSRTYHYVLPLFALFPVRVTNAGKAHLGYHYHMVLEPKEREKSTLSASATALTVPPSDASADGVDNVFPTRRLRPETVLNPSISVHEPTKAQPEIVYAEPFDTDQDLTHHKFSDKQVAELQDRVQKLMDQYKGTFSFHNFTQGGRPGDPSMLRYMEELRVEPKVLGNHCQVLIIQLKGQSFLLHQIRKMIGLVIEIMRQTAPPDAIAQALDRANKRHIHLAPGSGLLLDHVSYDQYNAHRANPPATPYLDFSDIQSEITSFREDVLYTAIVENFSSDNCATWKRWNSDTAKYPYFVTNYPSEQAQPHTKTRKLDATTVTVETR